MLRPDAQRALDTGTLPEGVSLEMRKSKASRNLNPSQSAVFVFQIGPDNRQVDTKWDRVPR